MRVISSVRAISTLSLPLKIQWLATLPLSQPPRKDISNGEALRKQHTGLRKRCVYTAVTSSYKEGPVETASLSEHYH